MQVERVVARGARPISPRQSLLGLFDAAVAAADPARVVPLHLPAPPKGRTVVVGAGKASAAMALAFEEHWPGPLGGLVVTRRGHGVPCRRIEVVEAAHPAPDAAGQVAAMRILEAVRGLGEDDLVVALLSGGASALLVAPAPGLTPEDKQAVGRALLRAGASIDEMDCVRRHLSQAKGGRLAAAAFPARVEALLISDMPGDGLAAVASGPTMPDPTTVADVETILDRYGIEPPPAVRHHLQRAEAETIKPGDPRLARSRAQLVAAPQLSLDAAAAAARLAGVTPLVLGDAIEGEAREVGKVMAGIARYARHHGAPVAPPAVLLSGGATSVVVHGDGKGGRNVEFLLGLALALGGERGIWAIAGDTDGIDGTGEVAGAMVTPDTLVRARAAGLDPRVLLARNDAHALFEALGDQVVTGPTLTSVNDFRAILVLP